MLLIAPAQSLSSLYVHRRPGKTWTEANIFVCPLRATEMCRHTPLNIARFTDSWEQRQTRALHVYLYKLICTLTMTCLENLRKTIKNKSF
jgi:hypothetical protein